MDSKEKKLRLKKLKQPQIILLSGTTCSGKTTFNQWVLTPLLEKAGLKVETPILGGLGDDWSALSEAGVRDGVDVFILEWTEDTKHLSIKFLQGSFLELAEALGDFAQSLPHSLAQ